MLLRGQNVVGYRHYADDVVEKFCQLAVKNGMDIFRIFDALNDLRNLETAIKAVKKAGGHAQGAILRATRSGPSPRRQNEHREAGQGSPRQMGCDSICGLSKRTWPYGLHPYDACLKSYILRSVQSPNRL